MYFATFNINSTVNGIWLVPSGFRTDDYGIGTSFAIAKADGTPGAVTYSVAGAKKIDISSAMKLYMGTVYAWSWQTQDSWPTSLPGTAA